MNDQAFPIFYHTHGPNGERVEVAKGGLTKREYLIALTFQGIMASNRFSEEEIQDASKYAVLAADMLIEALNKK